MEQLVNVLGAQDIPPKLILVREEALPQTNKRQKRQ